MENWGCIKEEWATYYKDQTFNIGETTNNRLESTFFFNSNIYTTFKRKKITITR